VNLDVHISPLPKTCILPHLQRARKGDKCSIRASDPVVFNEAREAQPLALIYNIELLPASELVQHLLPRRCGSCSAKHSTVWLRPGASRQSGRKLRGMMRGKLLSISLKLWRRWQRRVRNCWEAAAENAYSTCWGATVKANLAVSYL
jgi:hypothetical protein